MKYRDLVSFESIEQVKELRHADDLAEARRDVETLVVSPRLAEQLTGLILPNMDLDSAPDAKGLLIVANYGTGKTHLMSVVSSILEHSELVDSVRSEAVREAAAPLGGRYRVIRAEIGATKMGLRDIITRELSDGLARLGVDFEFPDLTEVTNTKRSLEEMMAAFEEVHGDQGLLFVLDEMLEYLAGRRDHELRLDLTVLREIGEICKSTRFRFIGSVQEAVFDNPRFASAADAIVRVRERFAQVRISREDIAYVVEERLLRKTPEQKAMIRAHLQDFAPRRGHGEDLETSCAYLVHPAYCHHLTQSLVEKRRVADNTVARDGGPGCDSACRRASGLICYDTTGAHSRRPSNRNDPRGPRGARQDTGAARQGGEGAADAGVPVGGAADRRRVGGASAHHRGHRRPHRTVDLRTARRPDAAAAGPAGAGLVLSWRRPSARSSRRSRTALGPVHHRDETRAGLPSNVAKTSLRPAPSTTEPNASTTDRLDEASLPGAGDGASSSATTRMWRATASGPTN